MLPTLATIPTTYLQPFPDFNEAKLIPYVKYFKDGSKKWGFCDEHTNLVIDFQYDEINWPFHEGMMSVKKAKKLGFIDKTGQEVIPCTHYESVYWYSFFKEGLACLKKDKKIGFIDKLGRVIIPFIYDDSGPFSEGLAPVKKDNQWMYIDKTDNAIILLSSFQKTLTGIPGGFTNGFAKLNRTIPRKEWPGYMDQSFYINKKGQEIAWQEVPIESRHVIDNFWGEGLRRTYRDSKWGFMDENHHYVVPYIYNDVDKFSEGLAAVEKIIEDVPASEYSYSYRRTIWGFINKLGIEVIPFIYNSAGHFNEGIAFVKRNQKEFYIDKDGFEYWLEEK
jgi:hypothetical protein